MDYLGYLGILPFLVWKARNKKKRESVPAKNTVVTVFYVCTKCMQAKNCVLLCLSCVLTACRGGSVSCCILFVYSFHAGEEMCPTVYFLCTHYMQSRNCVLLCTYCVLTTCRLETVSYCVLAVYSLHAREELCPTVYLLRNCVLLCTVVY